MLLCLGVFIVGPKACILYMHTRDEGMKEVRLLLLGSTDAGDCPGDFLLQLALAGFGRWLFEGEGEHLWHTEHPVAVGESPPTREGRGQEFAP